MVKFSFQAPFKLLPYEIQMKAKYKLKRVKSSKFLNEYASN